MTSQLSSLTLGTPAAISPPLAAGSNSAAMADIAGPLAARGSEESAALNTPARPKITRTQPNIAGSAQCAESAAPNSNGAIWTPQDIKRLKQLAQDGYKMREVAALMGRTLPSIEFICVKRRISFKALRRLPQATKAGAGLQPVSQPAPAPISESELIAAHIKAKGIRRFERGCSGTFMAIQTYLREKGYKLNLVHNVPSISNGRGRPRRISMKQLIAEYVDPLRAADGLTPFGRDA